MDSAAVVFVPIERVRAPPCSFALASLCNASAHHAPAFQVYYLAANVPPGTYPVAPEHVVQGPHSERDDDGGLGPASPKRTGLALGKSVRTLAIWLASSKEEILPAEARPAKAPGFCWPRARVGPPSRRQQATDPPITHSCRPMLAFTWMLSLLVVGGCLFWLSYFAAVIVDEQLEVQEKSHAEYLGQLAGAYAFSIMQSYLVMDSIKVVAITVVSPQFMRSCETLRSENKRNGLRYCAQSATSGLYAFLVFIF